MNLVIWNYGTIVLGWFGLWLLVRKKIQPLKHGKRALWLLFAASLLELAAWWLAWRWLPLLGMVIALIGVSQCAGIMQHWFERRVNWVGLVVLIIWLTVAAITLANTIILWFNVLP